MKHTGTAIFSLILMLAAGHALADSNDEARRHIIRGGAAIEMAKSEADLALAAEEFRQATQIAPDMAVAWYNLGAVQAKLGQYAEAIASYKRYLALAPGADDAQKVSDEIIKLEFRQEQAAAVQSREGVWVDGDGNFYQLKNDGDKIRLETKSRVVTNADIVSNYTMVPNIPITKGEEVSFVLTLRGSKLAGVWSRGAVQAEMCTVPPESGEVEGDIDAASGKIVLRFQRTPYTAYTQLSVLSNDSCSRVEPGPKRNIELPFYGPLQAGINAVVDPNYRPGAIMLRYGWTGHLGVNAVEASSAAAAAGLKAGDEILAIDGQPVSAMSAGEAVYRLYGKPGSEIELRILHKKAREDEIIRFHRPGAPAPAASLPQ